MAIGEVGGLIPVNSFNYGSQSGSKIVSESNRRPEFLLPAQQTEASRLVERRITPDQIVLKIEITKIKQGTLYILRKMKNGYSKIN